MAGHSKWANIKHRKARQDARRAKVWAKTIREVVVAARLGGSSIDDNPRLRAAVDSALAVNMPRDTIDRAIARGSGGQDDETVDEVIYEGYGPGGVAILVEAMTDNRNRTVAEVRNVFAKHEGNLGTDGSVSYLFHRRGVLHFEPGVDEDVVMGIALDGGADDVESDEDGLVTVLTTLVDFGAVVNLFRERGVKPAHTEITMVPSPMSNCDAETTIKVIGLIDALDELDDVQRVYSNGEFEKTAMDL